MKKSHLKRKVRHERRQKEDVLVTLHYLIRSTVAPDLRYWHPVFSMPLEVMRQHNIDDIRRILTTKQIR